MIPGLEHTQKIRDDADREELADSEKRWWDEKKKLRTTGELVSGGGLSGGVMSVLYLLIGAAVWGLIGFGLDSLLKTSWIMWVGILVGSCGGLYIVYIHMSQEK